MNYQKDLKGGKTMQEKTKTLNKTKEIRRH